MLVVSESRTGGADSLEIAGEGVIRPVLQLQSQIVEARKINQMGMRLVTGAKMKQKSQDQSWLAKIPWCCLVRT